MLPVSAILTKNLVVYMHPDLSTHDFEWLETFENFTLDLPYIMVFGDFNVGGFIRNGRDPSAIVHNLVFLLNFT